MCNYFAIPT